MTKMSKKAITRRQILAGYSLIELLVVTLVFTILAVIATQTLQTSLRSTTKSENIVKVRENLSYALDVMTRSLRNAKVVNLISQNNISYTDLSGLVQPRNFQCNSTNHTITSDLGVLTSSDIYVDCAATTFFTYTAGVGSTPPKVTITISAYDKNNVGATGSKVTISSEVLLRTYPEY